MLVRTAMLTLAATLALGFAAGGCGDNNDNTGTKSDPLEEFCTASTTACDSVTLPQCRKIVEDAKKETSTADIDCAKKAKSCDETAVCLDQMKASGPATSQPSS